MENLAELVSVLVDLLNLNQRLARPFDDLRVGQTPILLLIPLSKALGKQERGLFVEKSRNFLTLIVRLNIEAKAETTSIFRWSPA